LERECDGRDTLPTPMSLLTRVDIFPVDRKRQKNRVVEENNFVLLYTSLIVHPIDRIRVNPHLKKKVSPPTS